MTRKKKIILLAAFLGALIALIALARVVVIRMLDMETRRPDLIQAVKTAMNRDFIYEKGTLTLWFRPTFSFTGVKILEKDGQTNFITADRLNFKIAILPLFRKDIVFQEITLDNPRIGIIREASGVFNVSDLLEEKKQDLDILVRKLRINRGVVRFTDHLIAPGGLTASLQDLNLRMDRPQRGKKSRFTLEAKVIDDGASGNIALDGSIDISRETESLLKSRMDATVKAKALNVGWYWPYYSRYVPFRKILGRLDIDSRYQGNLSEFTSKGAMTMHDLHFDYPPIFHAPLQPKTVHAVYDMKLDPKDIAVTHLDVTVDGVNVKGSCLLKDIHTDDLLIDARAVTSPIRWESFNHYVPYGVIPKDVADFIEQKIKGGHYRLDEGRLYGRVSQIAHMEKGDNYNVLYIRGRAEQGLLQYGPKVPSFNGIAGILELKGKDFILHNMTGKFGDAPFSLEGKLADYCLDTPTSYPFTMTLSPTTKEAAWLFREAPVDQLSFTGKSRLSLAGNGYTSNYNLNGLWDLTGAGYQYPQWLSKPVGKANQLSFKINMNPEETRFSSVRYDLHPLSLTATARYRYAKKRGLSLVMNSNAFQMRDLALMVPKLTPYKLQGMLQLSINGHSGPVELSDLRWGGEATFTGASFNPAEAMKPVTNLTGKIHLRGDTFETSRILAQLGSSAFTVQGSLVNPKKPVVTLNFSSPLVDVADLGLHHPKQQVRLKNVSGTAAVKDGDLQIQSIAFHLNESILNIKGVIFDWKDPRTDINVASPYLDWRDVALLKDLEPVGRAKKPPEKINLKAAFYVDAGRMDNLNFRKLRTNLSLEENILYLENVEFNALGGTVSGKSRIDLADAQAPRYQFSFKLANLSAEQCFQAYDIKERLLTGTLSAEGDMTAKGGDLAGLKKTALGNVRVQMEEGSIKKFPVLSKVLSILNVSQLFKLQLPEMVSGGMPYDKITGTLSFKDGILSTKDFFVRSDAMNMSMVGNVDMIKREFIHTLVGVQPLQTMDKTIGRIPVVGWILTNKNKSIVTVYFEVKGNTDNPTVTAIPAKAMARGVFDIFKNIFQLPAKLFTDTGDVILGR